MKGKKTKKHIKVYCKHMHGIEWNKQTTNTSKQSQTIKETHNTKISSKQEGKKRKNRQTDRQTYRQTDQKN